MATNPFSRVLAAAPFLGNSGMTAAELLTALEQQDRALESSRPPQTQGKKAAPKAATAPDQNAPSAENVMAAGGDHAAAMRRIESSGRYDLVGPPTRSGDRALGAYQVMGANLADWTKEVLGRAYTPAEFLKDKAAQDKVFEVKFGQHLARYGNTDDAASAWFSGGPLKQNANKSDTYITTAEYVKRFNRALEAQQSGASKQGPVKMAGDVVQWPLSLRAVDSRRLADQIMRQTQPGSRQPMDNEKPATIHLGPGANKFSDEAPTQDFFLPPLRTRPGSINAMPTSTNIEDRRQNDLVYSEGQPATKGNRLDRPLRVEGAEQDPFAQELGINDIGASAQGAFPNSAPLPHPSPLPRMEEMPAAWGQKVNQIMLQAPAVWDQYITDFQGREGLAPQLPSSLDDLVKSLRLRAGI